MNFSKTVSFCFISLILFEFLFVVSGYSGSSPINGLYEDQFLPLSLIGVVASKNMSSSVAILRNGKTGKAIILTVGESILNMELTHVLEDCIILKKGERTYRIFLGRNLQNNASEKIQRISREIGETDRRYNQLKSSQLNINSPKREFVRSEIQKRIKIEWPLIIKETNVVPNYDDGKISGFKVISLPGKTIASEIGIYKDDVIREVNGVELNDLSTLVWLHSQIFVENRFEVLIERDKKLFRQVYILK